MNPSPCGVPYVSRRDLVEQRTGDNPGSRSGRFASGYLGHVSKINVILGARLATRSWISHGSADAGTDVRLSNSSCRIPRGDTQTSCPGPSGFAYASLKTLGPLAVRRVPLPPHSRCLCCGVSLVRRRRVLASLRRSNAPCRSSYGQPQRQSSKDVLRGVGEPASSWQTMVSGERLAQSLTSYGANGGFFFVNREQSCALRRWREEEVMMEQSNSGNRAAQGVE